MRLLSRHLCTIQVATDNLGSIDAKGESLYTSARGGFVSAVATEDGALRIDDQTYRAYTRALEDVDGEYHSMEINLFWPNIRKNVQQRAKAYLCGLH